MSQSLLFTMEEDIKHFFSGIKRKSEDEKNRISTVFNSECLFQLELSMFLKDSGHYDEVILEYHIPKEIVAEMAPHTNYPWFEDSMYVDIVVRKGEEYLPIELKYVTDSFVPKISSNLLGSVFTPDKNPIEILKRHGAHDIRCYDFWKDVRRIEFLKDSFPHVVGGISLFLTNEESYKREPKKTAVYYNFGITDKRLVPREKKWLKDAKTAEGRPDFTNKQEYYIDWKRIDLCYKAFSGEETKSETLPFYYCMIKIA